MFRVTTLLIALALAGAPATSLACDWWCTRPSAQEHHRIVGCHGAPAQLPSDRAEFSATNAYCHDAPWTVPVVTEDRTHGPGPLLVVVVQPPALVPAANEDDAPTGAYVLDVCTRRGALDTVLRI